MKGVQHIIELVQLIEQYREKNPTLFYGHSKKERLTLFYQLLNKKEYTLESELAQQLVGSNEKSSAYQKLKSEFKNELLKAVLQLDIKEDSSSARKQAYQDCYKEWSVANILFSKNARNAAIDLCLKILKQAKYYDFSDLVMEVCRLLRIHFGSIEGNEGKFDQYNQLYLQYLEIFKADNLAEELYTSLVLKYVKRKATEESTQLKAKECYEQLKPYLKQFDSYRLHLSAFLIEMIIYSSVNNYASVVAVGERMIDFFKSKKYVAAVPLQIAYYQIVIAYIQLQESDKAVETIKICTPLVDKGSFNWFRYQELLFLLHIHMQDYDKAYKAYKIVQKQGSLAFMNEQVQETWHIIEAYIYFLIEVKQIKEHKENTRIKKFKLSKFANQTPVFSKDKRGMNIPILIVQILFLVIHRDYDKAVDKIEAVNKYCTRYLNDGGTFRSNVFIKMLMQIPSCGFHKSAVIRKTERYLQKLSERPLKIAHQSHEIEIIPYEALWQILLSNLSNKIYSVKR